MKEKIHPKYYPNAKVTCACGNSFVTGSTKESIRTDLCSACHPFFTGEMRIVDTAGQVDRFIKRLEKRGEMLAEVIPTEEKKVKEPRKKKVVYELVDEEAEKSGETASKS